MKTRLAYRIGSHLPKWLKILYYLVLALSLVYALYRLVEFFLVTIQKIGQFVFAKQNYWTVVLAVFVLLIGAFILAQFVLGLDPFGNVISWLGERIEGVFNVRGDQEIFSTFLGYRYIFNSLLC